MPLSNPYQIGGDIPMGPGANPIMGITQGGLQGLAQQYQTGYNSALEQNKAMYGNIMAGYQGLTQDVMGSLAGIGQAGQQQINDQYAASSGAQAQGLVNRGLGNTTVANSVQRGVDADRAKAQQGLSEMLAQLYAGHRENLGLSQLGFMNSVTAKYPNQGDFYNLYDAYGRNQQMAKDQAALAKARSEGGAGGFGLSGGGGMPSSGSTGSPGMGLSGQGYGLYGGSTGYGVGTSVGVGGYGDYRAFGIGGGAGPGYTMDFQTEEPGLANPYQSAEPNYVNYDSATGEGNFDTSGYFDNASQDPWANLSNEDWNANYDLMYGG